jgi:hypothetical protein
VRRLAEPADLSVFGPYSTVGFERRNPELRHTHDRPAYATTSVSACPPEESRHIAVMLNQRKKSVPGPLAVAFAALDEGLLPDIERVVLGLRTRHECW